MRKIKVLIGIVGVIALIGVLMYFNSNEFMEKQVARAAQKQAVAWCSEKYDIEVAVVSTKVHYNNPVKGGFYFFTPNPNYGPTENATVTVLHQDVEFHVYCDTRMRNSEDDYQKEEIMNALRNYIQEDLGLNHLVQLSCSYGRRGVNNYEIDYLFSGDVKEFLSLYSLSSAVLECVNDDFTHLTAQDVVGHDSYLQRYAVLLSYRSADMVGAVTPSIYPIYDQFEDYGEYLDSYCILSNIRGDYETEHYLFDLDGSINR